MNDACGSCGKRALCVFQGAVDAISASMAPAASTGMRRRPDMVWGELGHLAESAIASLRVERLE